MSVSNRYDKFRHVAPCNRFMIFTFISFNILIFSSPTSEKKYDRETDEHLSRSYFPLCVQKKKRKQLKGKYFQTFPHVLSLSLKAFNYFFVSLLPRNLRSLRNEVFRSRNLYLRSCANLARLFRR